MELISERNTKQLGSSRGLNLPWSPIRSLMPYAREAKSKGVEILHLNIGQPDIPTPPSALQKMKEDQVPIIEYGPSEGLESLRKVVADYYKNFAPSVDFEDVYVTTGASEAINFALMATCDLNDQVIIPEPFYANYLGFSTISGVEVVAVTSKIEDQFSLPKLSDFEAKITDKTKAILLCNPGNPTGQLYTKEDLESLMQLVVEKNLFLIVDEVYREFCYDGKFHSVLNFLGYEDHVIVIDSVSKVFSSCGARVGFLVTKNIRIQESVLKFAQMRLCPPYFGQKLSEYCYQGIGNYIQKAWEEYVRRRELLYSGLQEIEGAIYYKPQAAFYNIVELPIDDSEKFCKWLLTDFRRDNCSVMMAPASGFYFNAEKGKRQVRIAYVLNSEKLKKAMTCLKYALKEYNS